MTPLVGYLLLFLAISIGFIFVHLLVGKLIRPAKPSAEKLTIYECGEPTVGSAWVQFDLRFYVIALLFVIFDVEVAFFFPWALVFGKANEVAEVSIQEQQAQRARQELLGAADPGKPVTAAEADAARRLAWIAFIDILVFFGVLLVGFAYLWKRGDLQWVRSMAAEEAPAAGPPEGLPPVQREAMVGAGSS